MRQVVFDYLEFFCTFEIGNKWNLLFFRQERLLRNFVRTQLYTAFDIFWSQIIIGLSGHTKIRKKTNFKTEKYVVQFCRIWWICSFTLSMILCVIIIANIWRTRENHPVIVSFDDKYSPISTIPFPAITICTSQIQGDIYDK